MSEQQKTPAQKRGINVGDWCEVIGNVGLFTVGSEIYLLDDDGTHMPKFSDGTTEVYAELSEVHKLEQKTTPDLQTALDHLDKAVETLEKYAKNGNYERRLSDIYRWATETKALLFSAIMDSNKE